MIIASQRNSTLGKYSISTPIVNPLRYAIIFCNTSIFELVTFSLSNLSSGCSLVLEIPIAFGNISCNCSPYVSAGFSFINT